MKTLIIYDQTGRILTQSAGEPAPIEPVGVPFLWAEIPENKYVESVDVTQEPHAVVFGDYPITEVEQLRVDTANSNAEMFEMILMMSGGAM